MNSLEAIKEMLEQVITDIYLLKHDQWIPDERSCDVTIENLATIAEELGVDIDLEAIEGTIV